MLVAMSRVGRSSSSHASIVVRETVRMGTRAQVSLAGELTPRTVPEVQRAVHLLLSAGVRRLTLDLRELDFLHWRGVAMIDELQRRMREEDAQLTIVPGDRDEIQRTLRVSGIADRLTFSVDGIEP